MRIASSLIAASALTLAAAACSTDDAFESLVENAIERESGEDVNIDFDSGDGSFSIDTGEGSMSMDEDGNFVITDENGEVITGDIDVGGDGFDVSTDDGSFSMGTDEDGNVTMETEDGTFSGGATTEVPDEWPSDVPEPSGVDIDSGSVFTDGQNSNVSVTGTTGDGADWAESYGAQLEGAGFDEQSSISSQESVLVTYARGEQEMVSMQAFDDGDGSWFVSATYVFTAEN